MHPEPMGSEPAGLEPVGFESVGSVHHKLELRVLTPLV